jgi:hypothetical protein
VPLEKLLLDNLDAAKDLDSPLAGKRLAVCALGVSPPVQAATPAAATAAAPAPSLTQAVAPPPAKAPADTQAAQLKALLDFKAAVDKRDALAWSAEQGRNAGYCSFTGVTCDARSNVANITLGNIKLGGTLPPASVLRDLVVLTTVGFGLSGITGPLPSDWGALTQLEDIRIGFNLGITGTIPRSWAGLTRLKALRLS